jgi:hypothetical protein
VTDQTSIPTYAPDLAGRIEEVIELGVRGLYQIHRLERLRGSSSPVLRLNSPDYLRSNYNRLLEPS